MGKKQISKENINAIYNYRKLGMSLDEILSKVSVGRGSAYKYIKIIDKQFPKNKLYITGKGSIRKSKKDWELAKLKAKQVIGRLSHRDRILILASLYWGEGTKREFNLINSDPILIKVFLMCLKDIGLDASNFKVSLRAYEDLDILKIKRFWSGLTGVPFEEIGRVEILKGSKKGKLEHGMCRIRVKKSAQYFKFIMSVIDLIKSGMPS